METPIAAAAAGKSYKRTNPVGRGIPDITAADTKKCSCKRVKTLVFCRSCGFYCHGRIRIKCEQHPRVAFLLDIVQCPKCHSTTFLDEYHGKKNPFLHGQNGNGNFINPFPRV